MHTTTHIHTLIHKASSIIAPIWPMQTIIARNPLHGMESLPFKEALETAENYLHRSIHTEDNQIKHINQELVKWCQVFLDQGQATISMPNRDQGFYRSWLLLAPFDDQLGSFKENQWLSSLSDDPEEAICFCLDELNIAEDDIEEYLRYTFSLLPGWAGYIQWLEKWPKTNHASKHPVSLIDFLAVRLIITLMSTDKFGQYKWKKEQLQDTKTSEHFLEKLEKTESTYRSNLLKELIPEARKIDEGHKKTKRVDAQLVFCIDVRSEPLRRRIELEGNYETFGFAGFFGLPVSIYNYNTQTTKTCCPVILKPNHTIQESPIKEKKDKIKQHDRGRKILNYWRQSYKDLKYNFGTPFALMETMGFWSGVWMTIRTVIPVESVKLKKAFQETIQPTLNTIPVIDIPIESQILYAKSALKMIGLTKDFSPIIVLCGHKSSCENNHYASALDCGACGGNQGGPSGRILAAILNDPLVRASLITEGIRIPDETLFIGAEHNTTTDEVLIEDGHPKSPLQIKIIEKLQDDMVRAGMNNSQYRCRQMGIDRSLFQSSRHVIKRSSDWSEVRPEWGLARNAAFIIGPRSLTKDLDLDGRCFLHSYIWEDDLEGQSLQSILTGPMIVTKWINAQYFFSTLNNSIYGSGSKITHNITGKFGVMQGNSSDLMHGLPLQSLQIDDDQMYHQLIRLQVIVYAPRNILDTIINQHSELQNLIFNEWITFISIDPRDHQAYRLINQKEWVQMSEGQTLT